MSRSSLKDNEILLILAEYWQFNLTGETIQA